MNPDVVLVGRQWSARGDEVPRTGYERLGLEMRNARWLRSPSFLPGPDLVWRWLAKRTGRRSYTARQEFGTLFDVLRGGAGICHYLYGDWEYHYAGRMLRAFGIRSVVSIHQPPGEIVARGIRPETLSTADLLIALGTTQRDWLRERCNCPVEFVPHGIDYDYFSPPPDLPPEPSSGFRLALIGTSHRDFPTMLEVVEKLAAVVPLELHCLLSDEITGKLSRFAPVTTYRGLTDSQLRSLYWRVDCVFLPLLDGVASNVVLEAGATGTPIVLSAVPDTCEYLSPDLHEVCVYRTPDDAVRLLAQFANNDGRRKRAGAASHEWARRFHWSRVVERLLNLYSGLGD